jgi:hypothetical protein
MEFLDAYCQRNLFNFGPLMIWDPGKLLVDWCPWLSHIVAGFLGSRLNED